MKRVFKRGKHSQSENLKARPVSKNFQHSNLNKIFKSFEGKGKLGAARSNVGLKVRDIGSQKLKSDKEQIKTYKKSSSKPKSFKYLPMQENRPINVTK